MTDKPDRRRDGWFTSSFTNGTGACVEVKFESDAVLVRDSKDRRRVRPVVAVPANGWSSFVRSVGA